MKGMDFMSEELFNEFKANSATTIKQYLLSGKLYEKYTDLSTYGVRIEKTTTVYGGTRSKITNEIHGIFCRRSDAVSFMEYIREQLTPPERLSEDMNRFIELKYLSYVTA